MDNKNVNAVGVLETSATEFLQSMYFSSPHDNYEPCEKIFDGYVAIQWLFHLLSVHTKQFAIHPIHQRAGHLRDIQPYKKTNHYCTDEY